MDDWFSNLAAGNQLTTEITREIHEYGFVVLPGPVLEIERLALAYDAAVTSAHESDVRIGKSSTRVTDFVNRNREFAKVFVFPPLLEACCRIIGQPFKLSSMHARTVHPRSAAQELHVDVQWKSDDWPLVGFILMVDEFRTDNGATRFVPGSHRRPGAPEDFREDEPRADYRGQFLACGPAGSLIIFNGSTWHGHTANISETPRRSIQGAFIPRSGRAQTDFVSRMQPETRACLSPLARHVLQL